MSKIPAFQFYTGDWMKDPALRAVSSGARGLWIDCMCLMWESSRKGFLVHRTGTPVTTEQLARMTGNSLDETAAMLSELENCGVSSRTDDGILYSRRIERDERKREKCREAGKRGGNPTLKGHAKGRPKGDVNRKPTPSSSTSSSSSIPPPPTPSGGNAEWQAVAAEIVDLGVEDLDCLRTATNNAVPLVEIRAVLDHFREHYQANGWGPAALHFRLSRAYPGVPPDRGWPPPDPQVERRTQRQQATQEQARAAEQRQRERNAADDAYEALEREYGSTLDGMTPEAQLALASEVGPTLVNLLRNRGSPSGKSIRQPLLSHLKNQRAA